MTVTWYVIDTSSLIELNKHNPMDVYPGVWTRMEQLIGQGRLHAPKEVYHEIGQMDDRLFEWSKDQIEMFIETTKGQIAIVREILADYPGLIHTDRKYDADPWVIALTVEMVRSPQRTLVGVRRIVVTEERIRGNKVRIPFVCRELGIESIDILDLFRTEGWKF